MSTRHSMLALAVAVALGAPAAAGAQDLGFTYLEGGFIAGFVNDVEQSGTITGNGSTLELETDAGGGGFIGGAWQFWENLHLFGEYSQASQDLEVSDGIDTFYGRLSFDNAELKDVQVSGFDLEVDADEDGIGGEVGMIWAATPVIHLQGHVRYTSVGAVATDGSDTFDSDTLIGLNGRWYFRPDIALVTGYEYGGITTWNVGVRFGF